MNDQDERAWNALLGTHLKLWTLILPDKRRAYARAADIDSLVKMVENKFPNVTSFVAYDGVEIYRMRRGDA